ncbi:spermidine/putrescine transport system substrate-binding protein [Roseovarius azorensis]|uniref:Spermidine/putrescine transport system substrate-binding protein n=1 Tax=Roseovarius azorensis TaxID=1287727 RepID=A0A1H7XHH3_9RHOB|nr:spermidine/putrescine ABC transporter substrate-binding protein [Roseovarius azorensis]SEM32648.1 spermidine/putrescine transport system substrate-binding protein [Roseovarius azorensis]
MRKSKLIPLKTAGEPSRRSILKMSAAAAMAPVMMSSVGWPGAARAEEVERLLNIMGWSEYISPENIERWEEKTGARFIFDGYSSNDEMLSKLQLSGGQSGYDVGMNTDFMIPLLISRGLIQKIDKSKVPNMKHLGAGFTGRDFDPNNDYTIPKTWGSQGYIYDKSVINRQLNSWGDFLDAAQNEASGQVALLDDPLAIAPLMWKDGISWNTTDNEVLDRVEAEAVELARHIRTFNTYPQQDVASGTVKLAQNWNGYSNLIIESTDNVNLTFDFGGPITEIWLDSYHMPVGGAHPNAAHDWLNYVLDPEVAARETTYTGYATAIPGSAEYLDESVANNPIIFPSDEVIARGELTQRNESYDRRVAIFTKFKAAAAVAQ